MSKEPASELINKAHQANQGHIFRFWDELSDTDKEKLLEQVKSIDFELLHDLAEKYITNSERGNFNAKLEPAEILAVPKTKEQLEQAEQAKQVGENLLKQGKVAAVLVAGGQGTRLGYDGPKGKFAAAPISKKSLFQLHAEKIKALGIKYGQPIPWFIMTSEANDGATREYFKNNNYFGLGQNNVFFFIQGMIPALDENGKIFLSAKNRIFTNPNGHGGTLIALRDSGALAEMKNRGVEQIFYFQVDNVLIQICDPYFLGHHSLASAEMSAKVVAKRDPYEKVGVIGKLDGKVTVIEYSDLPESEMQAQNPDGSLKFNGGSIAIHVFRRDFIERLTSGELKIPYHAAFKKIPYIDEKGNVINPQSPNGYKFEMFIFDALPYAQYNVIMEVLRENDFSPIKNKKGEDSAATAKHDLINYYGKMLQKAGVDVPFDSENNVKGMIEISSLFALDENDLKMKIDADFKFRDNLYLE